MKVFIRTPKFERQAKSLFKKHYDPRDLFSVLAFLEKDTSLPHKYKDHALIGDMQGYRECHIKKNWLLVYKVTETAVILLTTGSHDDIFK